jgi:hypothetical protein
MGYYFFLFVYVLFPVLYAISENQKQSGKGFHVFVCSLSCALCDLDKSETEGKLAFYG